MGVVLAVLIPAVSARALIDTNLQMQLGNPSGAIVDTNNHNHYLIRRAVEAIDYSDNLGEPVWASWDLTASDIGGSGRNSTFYTDTNLPANFRTITTTDYNGVGTNNFNRGHLCPSADRTDTTNDNKLVFFMSNIMPQSALNNQDVWGNFEDYCRAQLTNNELLIICGPSGFNTNDAIPSGKVIIASNTWKVVVCVPLGSGTALSRISATNRVIALSIPNVTNGLSSDWHNYVTNAAKIERDTGFTFFTALPPGIASIFRAEVDGTPYFIGSTYVNRQFSFTVNGWAGTNYVVQATANLSSPNWISLKTNAAPFTFTDTNSFSQRFYRAKILQ